MEGTEATVQETGNERVRPAPSLSPEYLAGLVRELCKAPGETEWIEFKRSNADPSTIGEYISALANGAALSGKANGYVVWAVADDSHEIVGTTFDPATRKIGNEELESWLLRLLTPKIDFRFFKVELGNKTVVLLEIDRASHQPVRFQGQEFIRVGTYRKKLKEFPERERALWRIFDRVPFEDGIAVERTEDVEVLRLLDYPSYFDLLSRPLPESRSGILEALEQDHLIVRCPAGDWNITNLGAILFAKRLLDFAVLRRKAMRVILYKGNSRVSTVREHVESKGYANGFGELVGRISSLVPSNEVIGRALRKTVPMYPELAVREIVANALIHQDVDAGVIIPQDEAAAKKLMKYLPWWAVKPGVSRE